MRRVDLYSDKVIGRILADHDDVRGAVKDAADEIGGRARGVLSGHTHAGDARIVVEHGDTDSLVSLDDQRGQWGALSIEFGHHAEDGTHVEGVHALYIAAGLL
ncbi:DUF5403 family protein [Pseudonocardia sp. RS010]|uniref:DUF5403 family protein n=1 Tax=Pseudonocardia sp. RS010 TaxID=3385979 RepID=UPI00399F65FF